MTENFDIKYKPSKSIKKMIEKLEKSKIISDPDGSYTGIALDKKEKPVQDADDL